MAKTQPFDAQATAVLTALAVERRYADFIEQLFGLRLWSAQREIAEAFFWEPETAVPSHHDSGKSFVIAACCAAAPVMAFLQDEECIVLTTSASWTQVEKTIWTQMHRFIAQSRVAGLPTPLLTEWRLAPRIFALGLSVDNATAIQGFHAERVHVAVDETAGIDNPEIFQAMDSLRAGISFDSRGQPNVTVIYSMNPTRASGPEVDLCRRPGVKVIRLDAFKSPNFWLPDEGRFLTPEELARMPLERNGPLDKLVVNRNLITPRYAREILDKYGTGPASPWWPRVRGEFPQQDFDALFLRTLVTAAQERVLPPGDTEVAGIDVAGPGEDRTAVTVRRGPLVTRRAHWRKPDPVFEIMEFLGPPRDDLELNVDEIGIGYGLVNELRHRGYKVNGINVNDKAFDSERFANRKAELYWGLRDRFIAGDIAGAIDEELADQLCTIQYEHNPRGQIAIEPKERARRRGLKSPDDAESLMLAFASQPALAYGSVRSPIFTQSGERMSSSVFGSRGAASLFGRDSRALFGRDGGAKTLARLGMGEQPSTPPPGALGRKAAGDDVLGYAEQMQAQRGTVDARDLCDLVGRTYRDVVAILIDTGYSETVSGRFVREAVIAR